jgi:serine/threonine protein kinase
MTETLYDGFSGFGLSGLALHSPESEEVKEPAVQGLDSVDTDTQLSAELGKLIRVVSDIKHYAPLFNRYGHEGYFNILNSHPVATGSFFQVRKLDGVETSRPMVAKYPRIQATPTGYGITQSSLQSIRLEIEALCHEPLRKHPNIIDILGTGWSRLSSVHNHLFPALFLEFATHGTLEQYLSDNSTVPADRMRLARDVGEGLNALHESGIVHGDLKLENVLVFDRGDGAVVAKLADFGSTVQLTEFEYRFRGGTRPWNAPEWQQAIEPIYQHSLDIYSFGLLTWSLCLDGETPFPGMTLDEIDIRKTRGLTINDAIKSVTEYYDFYNSTLPDLSEMEQFDLYMISVLCPINLFHNTLIVEPSQRNLHGALEGLNPDKLYG